MRFESGQQASVDRWRSRKIVADKERGPAILISRLLLRMRRMYVGSFLSAFH